MKSDFVRHLICPVSGEPLILETYETESGQVKTGRLVALRSSNSYPIINFVPRFVNADDYAESFSHQRLFVRRHFDKYRQDKSGDDLFTRSTGFSEDRIRSGLSLEVGCGYGRFVDVVQRMNGEIVGIDLSTHSIELAQSFVGLKPNVNLVQCDLFRLPFRKGTFRNIFSIGVLHHTKDCKKAFQSLPPYLANDGEISVWLYHPNHQCDVAWWRRFTTKWSPEALYRWCTVNQIAFGWIRMIPFIRWQFNRLIPGSVPKAGQSFWLRVMEDFDNLSPVYASSHTPEEVAEWFRECGLSSVHELKRLTSVTGVCRKVSSDSPVSSDKTVVEG